MKRTLARLVRFVRTHLMRTLRYNVLVAGVSFGVSLAAIAGLFSGANVLICLLVGVIATLSGGLHTHRIVTIIDHDKIMKKIRIAKAQAAQALAKFPHNDDGLELFLLDDFGRKKPAQLRQLLSAGQLETAADYGAFSKLNDRLLALKATGQDYYSLYNDYRLIAFNADRRFAGYQRAVQEVAGNELLSVRLGDGHIVAVTKPQTITVSSGLRPSIALDTDRSTLNTEIDQIEYVFGVAGMMGLRVKVVHRRMLRELKKQRKVPVLLPEEIREQRARIRYLYEELQPRVSSGMFNKRRRRVRVGGYTYVVDGLSHLGKQDVDIMFGKTFEK